MTTDFILDLESLGGTPDGVIVDAQILSFKNDFTIVPTFEELVSKGKRFKINVKEQVKKYGRFIDESVLEFWKKQSEEARKEIRPLETDIPLSDMVIGIKDYVENNNGDFYKSHLWARGNSFDNSMLTTSLRQVFNKRDVFKEEPVAFWNVRCIRTAIETNLATRDQTTCPLPLGTLNGFIKHNSIHDIAKDVLMLIYSNRYAYGLDKIPDLDNTDPLSLPDKK